MFTLLYNHTEHTHSKAVSAAAAHMNLNTHTHTHTHTRTHTQTYGVGRVGRRQAGLMTGLWLRLLWIAWNGPHSLRRPTIPYYRKGGERGERGRERERESES